MCQELLLCFSRPLSLLPSHAAVIELQFLLSSCLLLLSVLSGRWVRVDSFTIGMPSACARCMWDLPYWHTFDANEYRSDGGSTWRGGGAHRDCCLLPSRALCCSRRQYTRLIGLEPSRVCPHHIKQPEHSLFSKASWVSRFWLASHWFGCRSCA